MSQTILTNSEKNKSPLPTSFIVHWSKEEVCGIERKLVVMYKCLHFTVDYMIQRTNLDCSLAFLLLSKLCLDFFEDGIQRGALQLLKYNTASLRILCQKTKVH